MNALNDEVIKLIKFDVFQILISIMLIWGDLLIKFLLINALLFYFLEHAFKNIYPRFLIVLFILDSFTDCIIFLKNIRQ